MNTSHNASGLYRIISSVAKILCSWVENLKYTYWPLIWVYCGIYAKGLLHTRSHFCTQEPCWCVQTSIVLHRLMSADASLLCGYPRCVHNICKTQSCCERLISADVDRCTAKKSDCTVQVTAWVIRNGLVCEEASQIAFWHSLLSLQAVLYYSSLPFHEVVAFANFSSFTLKGWCTGASKLGVWACLSNCLEEGEWTIVNLHSHLKAFVF